MQLMLTSFGVAEEDFEPPEDWSLFHRMPPVRMRAMNNVFMPDYAALLLCERLILDKSTFALLEERAYYGPYRWVSDAIKQLYHEGFIKLVDFGHILKRNHKLLQKMLEHDLKMHDQWAEPLRASLTIWRHLCEKSLIGKDIYLDMPSHAPYYIDEAFRTHREVQRMLESVIRKRKRSEYREALRQVLRPYLSYVNANIVLSNEIGVGFHDWADFLPFYRFKFLSVGKEDIEEECRIEESQKLFEVSFPEFAIDDTSILINALHDERVIDLREMVEKAVKGEVTFDQEFARSVLREVLGIERRTMGYRKIISYVTMPIGFVPWVGTVAQKTIEEAVGTPLERKLKQKYRWFYLLSDLAEESKIRDAKQSE